MSDNFLTTKVTKDFTKAHEGFNLVIKYFVFLCAVLCVPSWLNKNPINICKEAP